MQFDSAHAPMAARTLSAPTADKATMPPSKDPDATKPSPLSNCTRPAPSNTPPRFRVMRVTGAVASPMFSSGHGTLLNTLDFNTFAMPAPAAANATPHKAEDT